MRSIRTLAAAGLATLAGAAPALAHVNEQVPHGHPHGPETTLLVDLLACGGVALAAAAVVGGIVLLRRRDGQKTRR